MTSTAAHVEVLTAEVRTLMVGSRQITQSVAKQLDDAPLDEVEVFGRIRLAGLDCQVIGRHLGTGTLVRSSYYAGRFGIPYVSEAHLGDTRPVVCASNFSKWTTDYMTDAFELRPQKDEFTLLYGDRKVAVRALSVDPCSHPEHIPQRYTDKVQERCLAWVVNGADFAFRSAINEHDEWVARNKAAAASPLIVLAGLR